MFPKSYERPARSSPVTEDQQLAFSRCRKESTTSCCNLNFLSWCHGQGGYVTCTGNVQTDSHPKSILSCSGICFPSEHPQPSDSLRILRPREVDDILNSMDRLGRDRRPRTTHCGIITPKSTRRKHLLKDMLAENQSFVAGFWLLIMSRAACIPPT